LDDGKIGSDGETAAILTAYLKAVTSLTENKKWERTGTGRVLFDSIEILDASGSPCSHVLMGYDLLVRATGTSESPGLNFNFATQIETATGTVAIWAYDPN
jgi:hypothetical protein